MVVKNYKTFLDNASDYLNDTISSSERLLRARWALDDLESVYFKNCSAFVDKELEISEAIEYLEDEIKEMTK